MERKSPTPTEERAQIEEYKRKARERLKQKQEENNKYIKENFPNFMGKFTQQPSEPQ